LEGAADVFGAGGGGGPMTPAIDVKSLHAMYGRVRRETGKRLTVEVRHGEGVANRTGPE